MWRSRWVMGGLFSIVALGVAYWGYRHYFGLPHISISAAREAPPAPVEVTKAETGLFGILQKLSVRHDQTKLLQ
ncbi:MAG: hypothetical protein R3E60_01395 [Alphaproteobacteria bacterium]